VDQGRKKKNRGDELIQVILYIRNTYIEMSQGNSLCSYPKQTKMSFFFHLQNWRTRGQNRSCLVELVPVGGREVLGKRCGRVNTVEILCTHV
jgi:hypothetical protein